MLVVPQTLDELVAVSLMERPVRSLDLIYLREHPLSTATRALMIHIRASVAGQLDADTP